MPRKSARHVTLSGKGPVTRASNSGGGPLIARRPGEPDSSASPQNTRRSRKAVGFGAQGTFSR